MDRKTNSGCLAGDLLLHHDRDAGRRCCKATFALVSDDAGIETGGEHGVDPCFQPIHWDTQDRLVAAGEGRAPQILLRRGGAHGKESLLVEDDQSLPESLLLLGGELVPSADGLESLADVPQPSRVRGKELLPHWGR